MPISFNKYVDINSVVAGTGNVPTRALSQMIITNNPLAPTGKFLSFTQASDVLNYFGSASEEYARAVMYFGWSSKSGQKASNLDFWFWNNNAATGSLIYGKPALYSLSTFNAITNGDFTLTLGGFTYHLTGINLGAAGSLAAVAAAIQTAVRAYSAGGTAWTAATVAFDATRGSFSLTSGLTGLDTVSIMPGTVTDLASPLGWTTGAIFSNGTVAQDIPTNLTALNTLNNNFGSFVFTTALALTQTKVVQAATWNNSLDPNIQYLYSISVTTTNATAWVAALAGLSGWTMTLQSPVTGEFPEQIPTTVAAATDYNAPNSTQNFQFQYNFAITPSVTNDADYATYTGLNINFYGQTQSAGQNITFYQQGVMGGGNANSPSFIGVYVNEMWFKDALNSAILNLLLAVNQVPASNAGLAMFYANIQPVLEQAITNGTISPGKILTSQQITVISQLSGDINAWRSVQNKGYYRGAVIQQYVENAITKYKIVSTIIYSKDDVILKVTGTDVLI